MSGSVKSTGSTPCAMERKKTEQNASEQANLTQYFLPWFFSLLIVIGNLT